ncbi:MAG: DUF3100 domain-containing protein, partial [Pseudomonadota bacterium]
CATALTAEVPEQGDLIAALAAGSNLMTGLTGLFITIFITIPLAEAYFKVLTRVRGKASEASDV